MVVKESMPNTSSAPRWLQLTGGVASVWLAMLCGMLVVTLYRDDAEDGSERRARAVAEAGLDQSPRDPWRVLSRASRELALVHQTSPEPAVRPNPLRPADASPSPVGVGLVDTTLGPIDEETVGMLVGAQPRPVQQLGGYRRQRLSAPLAVTSHNDVSSRELEVAAADEPGEASGWRPASVRLPDPLSRTSGADLRRLLQSDNRPVSGDWPYPTRLVSELRNLEQQGLDLGSAFLQSWAHQGQQWLHRLDRCQRLSSPEAGEVLDALEQLAIHGLEADFPRWPVELQAELRRVSFSVLRRSVVWRSVWWCHQQPSEEAVAVQTPSYRPADFTPLIRDVIQRLQQTEDFAGWRHYLLLDDIDRLSSGQLVGPPASRLAQRYLARLESPLLTAGQRELLEGPAVSALTEAIRPLAIQPIDYRQLLVELESLELDPRQQVGPTLNQAIRTLRYAPRPDVAAVGHALENNYRNANLRIAVAGDFLQRLLPQPESIEQPVQQTILGAMTRGASKVDSQLQLALVPDPNAWSLKLLVVGQVDSRTRSSRGPAVLFNATRADWEAARTLRIDAQGMLVDRQPTRVQSRDALQGVNTEYDSIPLVSELVQALVRQQFRQQRPLAQRISRQMIAEQVDQHLDGELEAQLRLAEAQFQSRMLGPLARLRLEPQVIDLQTTEQRLIARYRLAGGGQLAANTPRPRAPADSLMSIQIHQSAINNTFYELGLARQDWTIQQLCDNLAETFDLPTWQLPEIVPQDVTIRFAEQQPITIEWSDQRAWLTLRVAELRQPGGLQLERFNIRIAYRLGAQGAAAWLERDSQPQIDAPRLKIAQRLALRTIFTKIFNDRALIPLTSPSLLSEDPRLSDLAISQLELRDGWFSVAISHHSSPHVTRLRQQLLDARRADQEDAWEVEPELH